MNLNEISTCSRQKNMLISNPMKIFVYVNMSSSSNQILSLGYKIKLILLLYKNKMAVGMSRY